MTEGKVLSICY